MIEVVGVRFRAADKSIFMRLRSEITRRGTSDR